MKTVGEPEIGVLVKSESQNSHVWRFLAALYQRDNRPTDGLRGRALTLKRVVSLLLIPATLALTRSVLAARSFCSNASPTTLTSTLVLTSANNGQTFTNYSISTTSGPCVTITGATNVTIQQSNIGPCGTNNSSDDSTGIEVIGGSGENIFDNYIHVENLSSDGGDNHEGVLINGANDVTVQGNVLAFNETNVEINGGTSTGDVINGNFMLNPMGPFPRGQQFQSGNGTSSLTVENNRTLSCEQSACATHSSGTGVSCLLCSNSTLSGDAFPYYAVQEDAINIYGTATSTITDNWVEGGDSPSGQGILIDDGSGGTINITGNVLKDYGHGCVGPYGGGTITISNNKCESLTYIDQYQNGMYFYNPYSSTGAITISDNVVSTLFGNSSGTFDSGCNPATTSCYFNSFGGGTSGSLTLTIGSGNNYDNLYPAPIGGGSGSAYEALNPIASTDPPPLIPPEPENCVANSPYSQLSTPAWTKVQAPAACADPGITGQTSIAESYGSNVTAGNLLVYSWYCGGTTAAISGVTDTRSASWNVSNAKTTSAGSNYLSQTGWAIAPTSGAETITISNSSTCDYPVLCVAEFSPPYVGGIIGVDSTPATAKGNNTTVASTGNITTVGSPDLLYGWISQWGIGRTFGVGSGFTLLSETGSGGAGDNLTEYLNLASAGTNAATSTGTGSTDWIAQGVAFSDTTPTATPTATP